MLRVGKHIYRLHFLNAIGGIEHGEVSSLRGRVATDINDTPGFGAKDSGNDILMHAGAWRVGDDDVGTAVLSKEGIVEYIFHIAGEEQGVRDAVDLRVDLGILNGFGHILDADDLPRLAGNEVGDSACAGV